MKKPFFLIICTLVFAFASIPATRALSYPVSTPTGETPGGTYRTYFDNIFQDMGADCRDIGQVIGGFDSMGVPFCVVPVTSGFFLTGQTSGDTIRFDGTDWVRNNLLYNNGSAIGIANQTPSYLLDVSGTANFIGIRMPTGAQSGSVLTSDAAGLARWSNTPSITASGIVGGTQDYLIKWGPSGNGLVLSQFFDNGTEIGLGTVTPTAGYKLDIVGGDLLVQGVRIGRGGGILLANTVLGANPFISNVTSPNNIAIGNNIGATLTAGAGGNIFIGNGIEPSSGTAGNELNIGNWIYGSGGNIGIGVANTGAAKLEIAGQIKITGGSPATGRALVSDATGLASWQDVTATSVTATGITGGTEYYIPKFGSGGNGLYASLFYETGSRIGLINTDPTATLDINGNIRVRSGATLGYILTSDGSGLASWQAPGVSMNTWNTIGNTGTIAGTNFVGTTDAQDLVFKTSSAEKLRIRDSDGDLRLKSFMTIGNGGGNDISSVALGSFTLSANTTGTRNTALGGWALQDNTAGSYNTAVGFSAGRQAAGNFNSYLGYAAGDVNGFSNGNGNTGIGTYALTYAFGTGNTALGTAAASYIGYSDYNTAIGHSALYGTGYGSRYPTQNLALGYRAGYALSGSSSNNIFLGSKAGEGVLLGSGNIVIGYDIDTPSTTSSGTLNIGNLLFGTGLNGTNTTLSTGNIGIGTSSPGAKLEVAGDALINGITAGRGSGSISTNTVFGRNSLVSNTIGSNNVALGDSALASNTSGVFNSAFGAYALSGNTLGGYNIGVGAYALRNNISGNANISIGYGTLYYSTGANYNTAIGHLAMYSDTSGANNTAIGYSTLLNNKVGISNTAIGGNALSRAVALSNNTAIGLSAGKNFADGDYNVFIGNSAGVDISTGSYNVVIGSSAMNKYYSDDYSLSGTLVTPNTASRITLAASLSGVTAGDVVYMVFSGSTINGLSNMYFKAISPTVLETLPDYNVTLGLVGSATILYYTLTYNVPGDRHTILGYNAGSWYWGGNDTILIGANVNAATATGTNQLNIGNWIYGSGGNIGIGAVFPGAKLEVSGQVKITGGSPGANKVLVSDATGLASWENALTSLSGSFWSLSGNTIGSNDYIGTNNAQDLRFYTSGTRKMVLTSGGYLGIGLSGAPTTQLDLSGSALISGDLTVQGRVITDTIVNRTVNNVSISGSLLPHTAAPLVYRDIGSSAQRWNNLYLSGQVTIGGGSPGLSKILTSDANGLASWQSTFSGNVVNTGIIGGASGYLSVFGAGGNGLYSSIIFQTGSRIGIANANPGYTLDVSGTGSFSGFRLPTGAVAGRYLSTDASGNSFWTGAIASNLNIAGAVTGSTLYFNNNTWNAGTGLYNAGGNIGIGTASPNTRLTLDSGLTGSSGLRFSQISSTSSVVSNNIVGLGVDGSGNVVPISNGDVIVYDGITTSTPNPDPDNANREISYDFNKYFRIPAKQSFVVTDGLSPGQNAPYIGNNAASSVCEWTGTYGTGMATCPSGDFPGSPYNSFTMSARSDADYGYQIGLAYRGDIQLMARSGKFRDGNDAGTNVDFNDYGSGLYLGSTSTPAPWYKVLTLPTNHVEWFYIDTGYTGQWNTTGRAGNVGIGTDSPDSRFEIWNHSNGTSLMHFRGTNNVGIGSGTVRSALTGNANSGFGHESLFTLTNGYSNTAVGYRSMRLTAGGFNNSALGQEALYNNNGGSWNTGLGYQAVYSNSSGTGNIGIGPQSVYYNAVGANNIGIGYQAIRGVNGNSTYDNVAIGRAALYGVTGNNNVAIGALAGDSITSGANNIIIGYNADVPSTTASNQLSIGNWIYGSGGNIGIGVTVPTSKLDVGGTFELGTNGTQLNSIIKATVTKDVASRNTITCGIETFSVSNAQTTGSVIISPASALADRMIIAYARVSAVGTVEAKFCNESTGTIDVPSMNYYITVIQ